MLKKAWVMARTEIRMVFKSRQVKMIPAMIVVMTVLFGGLMTFLTLSWGLTDPALFNLMMSSIMGVVIIMLPIMLPILIAADSIVGEKERHTLTPLLATPLTDGELLLGKFLTALIPGLVVAYSNLVLAIAMVNGIVLLLAPPLFGVYPDFLSIIQAIILPVLFSILAVGIMVIISGRANTVYEAYQTGGVLILPAMAFAYSGFLGGTGLNWLIFYAGVLILIALDIILYRVAVKLFNRDALTSRVG